MGELARLGFLEHTDHQVGRVVDALAEHAVTAEIAVDATAAMVFSADDTCDVGTEGGALVTDDYPEPRAFSGAVNWVEILIGSPPAADSRTPSHAMVAPGIDQPPAPMPSSRRA